MFAIPNTLIIKWSAQGHPPLRDCILDFGNRQVLAIVTMRGGLISEWSP